MDAISSIKPTLESPLSNLDSFAFDQGVVNEESTLGDKFFQILSETKQGISEKTSQIESALSVEEITPVDLIRLQFEIAEITIQQELISKGLSKSTQNVDTLLKAQ